MNGLKFMSAVLFAALFVVFVLMGASTLFTSSQYGKQYEETAKIPELIHAAKDSVPYITDTANRPVPFMKMGKTYIMHTQVLRRSYADCFSFYVPTLVNQSHEFIQFQPRYTTVIVDREQVLDIPVNLDLPADMAPGEYDVQETVFPTCHSFSMPPYDMGFHLKVNVQR